MSVSDRNVGRPEAAAIKPQSFFDEVYQRNPEGWGCSERSSQLYRYGIYYELLSAIRPFPQNVLDLGCGEGFLAAQLKRRGAARVVGIDLSAVAINRARRNYPELEFHCCSITEVPWRLLAGDRSPDVVLLGEVLYYLSADEQRAAVESIYDAVGDGTYVLASVNLGPPPYFGSDSLRDLFRNFQPIETRGIYLKTFHKYVEGPLWYARRRFKAIAPLAFAARAMLRLAPIRIIDALSRRISKSEECIRVELFRKGDGSGARVAEDRR